ncbi:MAG: sugar ABC transporter permease [Clostridia bacterium]|nr:sugar ABC transporter permease [Clostridia bacterium]
MVNANKEQARGEGTFCEAKCPNCSTSLKIKKENSTLLCPACQQTLVVTKKRQWESGETALAREEKKEALPAKKVAKKVNVVQRKSNVFYAALMAFPVIQFLLFYVAVNFKSFGYAFMQQEKISDTEVVWHFTFRNITQWFTNSSKLGDLLSTTKMSLLYYAATLLVSIPLGLLFAYYIFKKMPASKLFRVFLFIPSIMPAAAFVLTYKIVLNDASPVLLGNANWRFDNNQLAYILFYNLYVSFGTSVLMYANKMFDISPEVVEAAKLDGATDIKEFWYVILPLTFPTLSVFLVTGVATIFTNQYNLFLFHGDPEWRSLGYYMYILSGSTVGHEQEIPNVAALGIILTAVAIPLTFLVKYCLEKLGPSED